MAANIICQGKKTSKKSVNYLTIDGIKLLLQQPDQSTPKGRRDLAMLSLMYDCAARVQEIIDLTPAMIRLTKPYTVKIIGKGNKPRIVPLMEQQVFHLKHYLAENRLLENRNNFHPLFSIVVMKSLRGRVLQIFYKLMPA